MGRQTAPLNKAGRRLSIPHHVTTACVMTMMLVSHVTSQQPSVTLNSTVIHGNYEQVGDVRVSQFLGIRFGQSPTGALRFQKPRAAQLREGDVNATQHGAPCVSLQAVEGMSEDCLFLDVYVPETREGARPLPVMVWIYGGAFWRGSTAGYKGNGLVVEGDVILVAPNYRLGPFGFLSTGDSSVPGNYGLWDQWLALKWVQENIQAFGGDVSRVTLFGESAGSASVSYQVTSPHSFNLFQRVILQSGNRVCTWTYNNTYSPLTVANGVATALNCPTAKQRDPDSSFKMVTCLQEKSVADILTAGASVGLSMGRNIVWTPVVDGDFVVPYDQRPQFTGSFMAGINNDEGKLIVDEDLARNYGNRMYDRTFWRDTILTEEVLRRMNYDLVLSADPRGVQNAVGLLDSAFRESESNHSYVAYKELITIISAREFWVCTQQMLDSGPTTGNAYLYYFDHFPNATGGDLGMNHAMDLWYTFGPGNSPLGVAPDFADPVPQSELQLGQRFRTMLINYAKNGDPNRPDDASGWPAFPPYTKGDKYYLNVSTAPTVQSHVKEGLMNLFIDTVPALLQSQDQGEGEGRCTSGDPTGGAASLSASIVCLMVGTAALICGC